MVFIYLIIFLLGLSSQLFRNFGRILFQQHTTDHLRGKVMSIIISDSSVIHERDSRASRGKSTIHTLFILKF